MNISSLNNPVIGAGYPTQNVITQTWGTWTAPDNGFACASATGTSDDHTFIYIYNTTTGMGNYGGAWNAGSRKYASIAVSKGDVVTVGGSRVSSTQSFFVKGK